MYKIFKGFHLVETYQELKKAKRLAEDRTVSRIIKIVIASSIALVLWLLPINVFGVEGLTLIEQRLISIFVFATLMWVFEAVPAWTTSVLIVVLLLLTVSDSSLWFFRQGYSPEELGQTVKYKSIMHCFADPIIMLFIGGFILAIAATKSGLDVLLARVMLKPFGTQSRYVLLGFILVTAFFSMFLSNTATAAMMLTFLTPVLKALPADGKGKIGLALAIPVAANVGGMGTPIGTPPNAIALKYLNDPEGLNMNIGFGEWMSFMMPYTIIVLFIASSTPVPFQAENHSTADRRRGPERLALHRGLYHLCHYRTVMDVRQVYRCQLQCSSHDSGSGILYHRSHYETRSGGNQLERTLDGCRRIRFRRGIERNRTGKTHD